MREWLALVESKSGERGMFNREAAKKKAAENERRNDHTSSARTPVLRSSLRPYQLCNLTEVVVRASDTQESLARKVKLATILGMAVHADQLQVRPQGMDKQHGRRAAAGRVPDRHHGQRDSVWTLYAVRPEHRTSPVVPA